MRIGVRAALSCVLAASATLCGCETPAPRSEPPPPKVSIASPQARRMIDYDEYNGWVEAAEVVEVRARVRGHIQKVHFIDGQMVKKGDLLFELDPRPFQQEIDRSVEQVGIFDSQLKYALVEEKRMVEMAAKGVASGIEVESAQAKARSLEAQVEAQKKEVERDRLELEYAKIDAPISGRISRALMTEGNLVNAGGSDPLLTTIVKMDPTYVYFNVDERALQRWQRTRGQNDPATQPGFLKDRQVKVLFGLETDEGYPRESYLDFADNRVDRATGTILVRAVAPNPSGQLVGGSRVRVRIPVSAEREVVSIADSAILTDQDKKYVLVLDDKNVVQRRDISPGKLLDDGSRVVLPVQGSANPPLTPSDRIIVSGLQMARLNYPVEPVKPATQPAASAAR